MSAEQFSMSKFASRQDRDDAMLAEIERLTAERDRAREYHAAELVDVTAERDAAFAMSRCQCSTDEACANLARLHAEVAELADVVAERDSLREDVTRLKAARVQFSKADAAEITALREKLALAEVVRASQVEGLAQGAGILRDERDALRAEAAQLRQYLDTAQRRASALGDEVAGLREALLHCGESLSIFDVRSIVRGALAAGKGEA